MAAGRMQAKPSRLLIQVALTNKEIILEKSF